MIKKISLFLSLMIISFNFLQGAQALKLDSFYDLNDIQVIEALKGNHELIDQLVANYNQEGQPAKTQTFIKDLLATFEDFEWQDKKGKTFQNYVKIKTAEMLNLAEARKIVTKAQAVAD